MVRISPDVKDEELSALGIADFDQPPDPDKLVGLAISGGGIRSATFGLGVLQALQEANLLRRIHYLSTVSGGGYIGAWFSANCRRVADRRARGEAIPEWRSPLAAWGDSIAHLRRYSNYLSPDVGFFSADTWSMFTIWLRNALLVQWTVVMAVACVLLLPRPLAVLFAHWYEFEHLRWAGVFVFVLAVVGIAANQQWVSRGRPTGPMSPWRWKAGVWLSVICLAVVTTYAAVFDFAPFRHDTTVSPKESFFVAALIVVAAFALLPGAVTLFGRIFRMVPRPSQVNYSQAHVQWFVVLPLLAAGFCVGAVLWGEVTKPQGKLAGFDTYGAFFSGAWSHWPFPLAVVFCSLWLLAMCSVRVLPSWSVLLTALKTPYVLTGAIDYKNLAAAVASPFVCLLVLHGLLCAIMLMLKGWGPADLDRAFVVVPPLVLFAFSTTVVVLIGMMGRQSTEGVREWWSRLGAWLLIYSAAWLLVAMTAVYARQWVDAAVAAYPLTSWSSVLAWLGTVAAGLFAGHSNRTGKDDAPADGNAILRIAAVLAPYVFIAGLLVGVATALDHIVMARTGELGWSELWASTARGPFLRESAIVLGVAAVALVVLGFRININEFSLNAFYRSRLVRCFLGATRRPRERRPQAFTAFDDADDMHLSYLAPCGSALAGPLHIVNCALNLGGSGDLALHTRHSASFTLTPFQIGSDYEHTDDRGRVERVGHAGTPAYGTATGRTTLGQAISVSGAAASPNMGYHTSPVVAFLLTVFNLRLGWWFPHPRRIGSNRSAPHFNLPYIFMELFGGATYQSNFLMVSDGGHFENLGVYELIKRRCRVIIVSDAECDPTLDFAGLGTLIRMCEVDLGASIRIDLGSLKRRDGGEWSAQRCAVGTIVYDDVPFTGTFIYFKATMTGHEPAAVLQYKASHPTFPHETTSDQFYTEDQFESYRRLGKEVACRALESALAAQDPPGQPEMLALAQALVATNAPSLTAASRFTTHSQSLIDLWDKIRANPDLGTLDTAMIRGGLPPGMPGVRRAEFYACVEMLQLMENVYIDLDLEDTWDHADNRGWHELFVGWAALPQLQATWQVTHTVFGERFRFFARRHLRLTCDPRP